MLLDVSQTRRQLSYTTYFYDFKYFLLKKHTYSFFEFLFESGGKIFKSGNFFGLSGNFFELSGNFFELSGDALEYLGDFFNLLGIKSCYLGDF